MTARGMIVETGFLGEEPAREYHAPDGNVYRIGPSVSYYGRVKRDADGNPLDVPKGLGTFRLSSDGRFAQWIYEQPDGRENWTSCYLKDYPNPPPLPRPESEWTRCGCREREHVCSACGKPYWVEIHGMADGYCTYCYHRG